MGRLELIETWVQPPQTLLGYIKPFIWAVLAAALQWEMQSLPSVLTQPHIRLRCMHSLQNEISLWSMMRRFPASAAE